MSCVCFWRRTNKFQITIDCCKIIEASWLKSFIQITRNLFSKNIWKTIEFIDWLNLSLTENQFRVSNWFFKSLLTLFRLIHNLSMWPLNFIGFVFFCKWCLVLEPFFDLCLEAKIFVVVKTYLAPPTFSFCCFQVFQVFGIYFIWAKVSHCNIRV